MSLTENDIKKIRAKKYINTKDFAELYSMCKSSQSNYRRRLFTDDYDTIERLSQKKTSTYNKDLYVTSCAICIFLVIKSRFFNIIVSELTQG